MIGPESRFSEQHDRGMAVPAPEDNGGTRMSIRQLESSPGEDGVPLLTVAELVKRASHWGLPHFQRGRVWENDHRARLLESLFDGTPCGSIILWMPEGRPNDYGSALVPTFEGDLEALVVDGQQRLSTLLETYPDGALAQEAEQRPVDSEEDGRESSDPDVSRTRWCLNLGKVADLSGPFNSMRRLGMFCLTDKRSPQIVEIANPVKPNELTEAQWIDLRQRLDKMWERKLLVTTRIQRGRKDDYGSMVRLYNRVNGSGMLVQPEERAYAAMLSFNPDAWRWMRDQFERFHGQSEHRDWLRRKRENRFGFSVFVRAFVQTVGYHRNRISLDFYDLERLELVEELQSSGEVPRFFDEADSALRTVRDAVMGDGGLFCDDLRFSPPIDAVRVLIFLLLRFPGCIPDELLPQILLRLTLRPREDRLLDSVQSIVSELTLDKAAAQILEFPEDLTDRLKQSQSTQGQLVHVLYWLLRRKGACDLLDPGVSLCKGVPGGLQVDHVIPYARLKQSWGLGRYRPGKHEIHDLANLTVLPGDTNWGKGGDWLETEKADDDELRRHFLLEPGVSRGDSQVLQHMDRVREAVEAKNHNDVKEAFEDFRDARRALIVTAVGDWLNELKDPHTLGWSSIEAGLPLLEMSRVDRCRAWGMENGWADRVKNAMLFLVREQTPKWRNGKYYWVIRRSEERRQKNWSEFMVRVRDCGTCVVIGQSVPGREHLQALVEGCQGTSSDDGIWYKIDPHSNETGDMLLSLLDAVDG